MTTTTTKDDRSATDAKQQRDDTGPRTYAAGTWGPAAASALVARDGHAWDEEE